MPGRLRIRDIESSLRKSIRRPDICKRSTATIRNPEARILPVPALVYIRIRCVVVVVWVGPAAVATEQSHIIHQRLLAGLPNHSRGARIRPAGEYPNAANDIRSARGSKQHWLWCTDT